MKYSPVVALCLALGVFARPVDRTGLRKRSSCTADEKTCVGSDIAQCVNGEFKTTPCGSGKICAASTNGASVTCTTAVDRNTHIKAARAQGGSSSTAAGGNGSGAKAGGDAQSSLTLDPSVIAKGFEQDGQATKEAGQVASLTSKNNFINFCATTKQPITNGQQIKGGSCNPAPIGSIPSTANMPSSKFKSPKNMDTIAANTQFTIQMNIQGMQTGFFVNAQTNYFSAPQQLNPKGQIIGHSHVVVEKIPAVDSTEPTDPTKFAFFLGLNSAAKNGVLTADVTNGLPPGAYRLASINTAANHQPCIVPVAQHGFLDDAVYFTVSGKGGGAATGAAANSTAAAGGTKAGTKSSAEKSAQTDAANNSGGKNRRWT